MSSPPLSLDISFLRAAYGSGQHTPTEFIAALDERITAAGDRPVWIHRVPRKELLARAAALA